MEEKTIIKESSSKWNIFIVITGLITLTLCVLALNMWVSKDSNTSTWILSAFCALALTGVIYWATVGAEIVVTNKRIYGKVGFGKRVDLPLDSVSAVATTSSLTKGVSVSTSSGRITFYFLANANEIANEIRDLLVKRQNKNSLENTVSTDFSPSSADELKKFKNLLDEGVISQEEFDAKKKQLLGL